MKFLRLYIYIYTCVCVLWYVSNFGGTSMDCITSFKTNKLILGCLTTGVSFHAPGKIVFFLGGRGASHILINQGLPMTCTKVIHTITMWVWTFVPTTLTNKWLQLYELHRGPIQITPNKMSIKYEESHCASDIFGVFRWYPLPRLTSNYSRTRSTARNRPWCKIGFSMIQCCLNPTITMRFMDSLWFHMFHA